MNRLILYCCISLFFLPLRAQIVPHTGLWAGSPGQEQLAISGNGVGKYEYIAIRPDKTEHLQELRNKNPNARILVILNASSTYNYVCPETEFVGGVSYCDANENHPDWFLLRKDNNQRVVTTGAWHLMDVGNMAYQQAWANRAISLAQTHGFDGVFLTDVNPVPFFNMDDNLKKYTAQEYGQQMQALINNVGNQLKNAGLFVAATGGVQTWKPEQVNRTLAMLSQVDLWQREHWMKYNNNNNVFVDEEWLNNITYAERVQQNGTPFAGISSGNPAEVQITRYLWASWLMAWNGSSKGSFTFRTNCNGCDSWLNNVYDNIGMPLENRQSTGVGWQRRFSDGAVVVNPSSTQSQSFTLSDFYIDLDGVRRNTITLSPGTAMVLKKQNSLPELGSQAGATAIRWPQHRSLYEAEAEGIGQYKYAIVHQYMMHNNNNQIRDKNPNTKLLMMMNAMGSMALCSCDDLECRDDRAAGIDYCDAIVNHPDWFLHDRETGEIISFWVNGSHKMMDIGNVDYQNAWAEFVIERALEYGYDGILLDDVNVSIGHNKQGTILEYTDEEFYQALLRFLDNVIGQLRNAGLIAVPNLVENPWDVNGTVFPKLMRVSEMIDGYHKEHFMRYGNENTKDVFDDYKWKEYLRLMDSVQRRGVPFLANTFLDPDDVRHLRFVWASYLMGWDGVNDGALVLKFHHPRNVWVDHWKRAPEWTVQIGYPLEFRQQVATYGWQRKYTDGVVVVNTSENNSQHFNLGDTYTDQDGISRNTITLPPKSAMVLKGNTSSSLPVTLANFNGYTKKGKNHLFWETSNEINNKQFLIERSADNRSFTTIGQHKGQNKPVLYNFIDETPLENVNYYRLAQVDMDGKTTYSKSIAIHSKPSTVFSLYPNPTQAELHLQIPFINHSSQLRIFNIAGQQILNTTIPAEVIQWSVSTKEWEKGMYFIEIQQPSIVYRKSVVKTDK